MPSTSTLRDDVVDVDPTHDLVDVDPLDDGVHVNLLDDPVEVEHFHDVVHDPAHDGLDLLGGGLALAATPLGRGLQSVGQGAGGITDRALVQHLQGDVRPGLAEADGGSQPGSADGQAVAQAGVAGSPAGAPDRLVHGVRNGDGGTERLRLRGGGRVGHRGGPYPASSGP